MSGNDQEFQIEEYFQEGSADYVDFSASASQRSGSNMSQQGSPVALDHEDGEAHQPGKRGAKPTVKALKLEVKKLRDAIRKRDERKTKTTGRMGRPRKKYNECGRRQKCNLVREAWKHLETTYGADAAPLIVAKLARDHASKEEPVVDRMSAPDTIECLREAKITVTQLRILKQQMAARGFVLPLASERAIKEWRTDPVNENFIEVIEVAPEQGADGSIALINAPTDYLTSNFVDGNGYATFTTEGNYYGSV
uniref:BZIP domain-containing protein n=1 Tax=Panagrellus redivivus TaxID=6233 RepID=A0A7E4V2P1_PANRE